jgi:hypothetical protein
MTIIFFNLEPETFSPLDRNIVECIRSPNNLDVKRSGFMPEVGCAEAASRWLES